MNEPSDPISLSLLGILILLLILVIYLQGQGRLKQESFFEKISSEYSNAAFYDLVYHPVETPEIPQET